MIKKIYSLLFKLKSSIDYRASFDSQYIEFGIGGFFIYPIYYFILKFESLPYYDNKILGLLAMSMCLPLIAKNHWPQPLRTWLPTYWYLTLLYCLPFLFTYFLLKNFAAPVFLFSGSIALFWLILLVDWLSYIVLFCLGATLAFLIFSFTTPDWQLINYPILITQFTIALVVIALFDHNRIRLEQAKLKAVSALGASIAHELRTPLATISSGIKGIKMYLPNLMSAYQLAKEANLKITEIRADHQRTLLKVLDDVTAETVYANTIVNMLLIKINRSKICSSTFEACSISKCIRTALKRYPFSSEKQAQLIYWQDNQDFLFLGKELLVVHIIFNLLKNALYFIAAADKGEIHIWLELGKKFNKLHFKDTSTGVAPDVLPRLFDRFFTTTHNGTGLGLAFCKMVMHNFGGDIVCYSQHGSYTDFVLSFPVEKTLV